MSDVTVTSPSKWYECVVTHPDYPSEYEVVLFKAELTVEEIAAALSRFGYVLKTAVLYAKE